VQEVAALINLYKYPLLLSWMTTHTRWLLVNFSWYYNWAWTLMMNWSRSSGAFFSFYSNGTSEADFWISIEATNNLVKRCWSVPSLDFSCVHLNSNQCLYQFTSSAWIFSYSSGVLCIRCQSTLKSYPQFIHVNWSRIAVYALETIELIKICWRNLAPFSANSINFSVSCVIQLDSLSWFVAVIEQVKKMEISSAEIEWLVPFFLFEAAPAWIWFGDNGVIKSIPIANSIWISSAIIGARFNSLKRNT